MGEREKQQRLQRARGRSGQEISQVSKSDVADFWAVDDVAAPSRRCVPNFDQLLDDLIPASTAEGRRAVAEAIREEQREKMLHRDKRRIRSVDQHSGRSAGGSRSSTARADELGEAQVSESTEEGRLAVAAALREEREEALMRKRAREKAADALREQQKLERLLKDQVDKAVLDPDASGLNPPEDLAKLLDFDNVSGTEVSMTQAPTPEGCMAIAAALFDEEEDARKRKRARNELRCASQALDDLLL